MNKRAAKEAAASVLFVWVCAAFVGLAGLLLWGAVVVGQHIGGDAGSAVSALLCALLIISSAFGLLTYAEYAEERNF